MMLDSMQIPWTHIMRTTINLDDKLLEKAIRLAGPMDRTAILSEALRALIERESAKRLARLGGTQTSLQAAPRRRATNPA
jgi:Arc/MetJ family transcription regulator